MCQVFILSGFWKSPPPAPAELQSRLEARSHIPSKRGETSTRKGGRLEESVPRRVETWSYDLRIDVAMWMWT
jgi:hypothetical protein